MTDPRRRLEKLIAITRAEHEAIGRTLDRAEQDRRWLTRNRPVLLEWWRNVRAATTPVDNSAGFASAEWSFRRWTVHTYLLNPRIWMLRVAIAAVRVWLACRRTVRAITALLTDASFLIVMLVVIFFLLFLLLLVGG